MQENDTQVFQNDLLSIRDFTRQDHIPRSGRNLNTGELEEFMRAIHSLCFLAALLISMFGCAADMAPEEAAPERTEARTLTEDYGEVLVSGVQFTNGDNVSMVYAFEDPTVPLAVWEFYEAPGEAAWEANGMTGETDDTPLSESLEEANWMAYTVWAAANDVPLDEGIGVEGCSCRICWIDPYGGPGTQALGVCCKCGF